jgi:hypothetical protein
MKLITKNTNLVVEDEEFWDDNVKDWVITWTLQNFKLQAFYIYALLTGKYLHK